MLGNLHYLVVVLTGYNERLKVAGLAAARSESSAL